MAIPPRIPMSPTELPQQRLVAVASLPERPDPFDVIVGFGMVPESILPKRSPRNPLYLGQVEWAWNPMSNRINAYYVYGSRSHWILWSRYPDGNWGKWEWEAAACVPRKGIEQRQAACHLLLEFWKMEEDEGDLDQFHWINDPGYLTVEDFMAIAREIW
jgi:hypothetical protein